MRWPRQRLAAPALIDQPITAAMASVLRAVAESHDNNCSPELRGAARKALGLGECVERQACIFRGGCETCGTSRVPEPVERQGA